MQGVTAISRKISRSWAPHLQNLRNRWAKKWGPTCDRDISNSAIYTTAIYRANTVYDNYLAHLGLVTQYGDIDLCQPCYLTALSRYLNQCWLTISKVKWLSFEVNFTTDTESLNHKFILKMTYSKFHSNFPGTSELSLQTHLPGASKFNSQNKCTCVLSLNGFILKKIGYDCNGTLYKRSVEKNVRLAYSHRI